jgi:chromosome segregation protein
VLRLKKLHILGFKSFCDRTEITLPGEGLAAIVGPNGCGKSNILDALNWVVGEQSAKSLRGSKMEDVIFAGTSTRRPMGMAEVSLTLIDPDVYDGPIPVAPEVEVSETAPSDWDESSLRADRAQQAEQAAAEVQPSVALDEQEPVAEEDPDAVTLKVRRRKFQNTARAGEIVVSRRLFRTGESEYLLNGKLCRLRDVQDIFMGIGLGPDSYAIIEQERIGQILSSRPHDRRAIIEEAAGITRFKTRKRLAELRLEQSRQNLARIGDIFDEVTTQMISLKRQAGKAERYAVLREELRSRLRVVLASRLNVLDGDKADAETSLANTESQLEHQLATVASMEAEHQASVNGGYELESAARQASAQASQSGIEMERMLARQRSNEERIVELQSRHTAQMAEISREREQLEQLEAERQSQQQFLETAVADAAAMRHQAQSAQQQAQDAHQSVLQADRALEGYRQQGLALLSRAGGIGARQSQASESLISLEREAQRLESEMSSAREELSSRGAERGQVSIVFDSASGRLQSLESEIASLEASLYNNRQQERETRARLDTIRTSFATLSGRCNSLEALINEHGYSTDTVRQLFRESEQNGLRPAGTLADFLEVDAQYEDVVDEFLREELNYVVVKSWDAANEGMRLLQRDVDGRATFLVHPTDAQARFSFTASDVPTRASASSGIVRLKDKVRVLDGFGRSLEVILPRLRDGYFAADSDVARDLALENPEAFFLSPSGECFHNVTVTGGKPRAEGPLALKRELRESQARLSALTAEIGQLETSLLVLEREITSLTQRSGSLQAQRRETEREHADSGAALRHVEAEVGRLEQKLSGWMLEVDRNRAAQAERRETVAAMQLEMEAITAEREVLDRTIGEGTRHLEELRATHDAAQQSAMELATRLAGLEERHRSVAAQFERIGQMHQEVARRLQETGSQEAASIAEQEQRTQENELLRQQAETLSAAREAALADVVRLEAEATGLRARVSEGELQLKALRQQADSLRDQRGSLQSDLARINAGIEHLEAACTSELGLEATVLREDDSIVRVSGDALSQEESEVKTMRQRLDSMGPVNLTALEEYNEVAQRHAFLETQRKDLLDSIENTEASIKEIDEISRTRFEEAFARINENFSRAFSYLFNGGNAFLRLTDEENAAESGLDIIAQPPGKRVQNVLLLSGGEKALAALSLLVGIFQYQPSPFCVLDEVDAPLDETNVRRLSSLIRTLSDSTQFIMITHSKQTMQDANLIFGVTMQEPGVSSILSVKLGQTVPARAIA